MFFTIRYYTVIRFVSISAKFGICSVLGPNGTLAEVKIVLHCYKTFRRIPPPSPDDAGLILLGRGK